MTNRAPLIAAILLLVLPVSYVASYFALVVPESDMMHSGREDPPHYYVGGVYAEIFYWPMRRVDVELRPKSWPWERVGRKHIRKWQLQQ
jgi:hypothetical protein